MNLTPLEIRKQEFERVFRGYNAEEVQRFLATVATEWESKLDDQRRLEAQIAELRSKIEHYQKVEEALQEALNTARENAIRTTRQAEEKADLILEKAELKAQKLVEQADVKARSILEDADGKRRSVEDTARSTVEETAGEKRQLKQEVTRLFDHRSEMLSRLRGFLLSEMEVLARYEEDDPIGFIKLLPADSGRPPAREESPDETAEQEVTDTGDSPPADDTRVEDAPQAEEQNVNESVTVENDLASGEMDDPVANEGVAETPEMEVDTAEGVVDSEMGPSDEEIAGDEIDLGLFVGSDIFESVEFGSEPEPEGAEYDSTDPIAIQPVEEGETIEDDPEESEEMRKIRRILRELS